LFGIIARITALQWLFLYRYHGLGNAPLAAREPCQPDSLGSNNS
jgi:hypothetical protein